MNHKYTAIIRNYTLKNIPEIIEMNIESEIFMSTHYNYLVSELEQLAFKGCDYKDLEVRVYKDNMRRKPFLTIKCITENDGFRNWTTVFNNGDVIRKLAITD